MLYLFVFTHVFIPKPVPAFGRHALEPHVERGVEAVPHRSITELSLVTGCKRGIFAELEVQTSLDQGCILGNWHTCHAEGFRTSESMTGNGCRVPDRVLPAECCVQCRGD